MNYLKFPYQLPINYEIKSEEEELEILFILTAYGFGWVEGQSPTDYLTYKEDGGCYILILHSNFSLTRSYKDDPDFPLTKNINLLIL